MKFKPMYKSKQFSLWQRGSIGAGGRGKQYDLWHD